MQMNSDTVHFVNNNNNNMMVRTSLRRSMSCERRRGVCVSCDGSGRRGGGCVSCDGSGGKRGGGCVSCDGSGRRGGRWRAKQVFSNSLESWQKQRCRNVKNLQTNCSIFSIAVHITKRS